MKCPGDGRCIPNSDICNSVPDCPGFEDEMCCSQGETCCHGNSTCTCVEGTEKQCGAAGGGQCVLIEKWCDGIQDCTDRTDELSCDQPREDSFLCSDR